MALDLSYVAFFISVSVALDLVYMALRITMPFNYKTTSKPTSSWPHRVIKIPDPLIFYGKPGVDKILYKDWLLKMKTKLQVNNVLILTEFYKIFYILSCLANNTLAQVSSRLDDKSTKPFITAKKYLICWQQLLVT